MLDGDPIGKTSGKLHFYGREPGDYGRDEELRLRTGSILDPGLFLSLDREYGKLKLSSLISLVRGIFKSGKWDSMCEHRKDKTRRVARRH